LYQSTCEGAKQKNRHSNEKGLWGGLLLKFSSHTDNNEREVLRRKKERRSKKKKERKSQKRETNLTRMKRLR